MELTEEQREAVKGWVAGGEGLSEIQKRIRDEYDIALTYMDVRFLILDLGVDVQNKEIKETVDLSAPANAGPADTGSPAPPAGGPATEDGLVGGGVSVEVDRVTKPGSVVSGTVSFSDGTNASWFLDQMGRLALDAGQAGYQPSPEDVESFQLELRKALEKRGF